MAKTTGTNETHLSNYPTAPDGVVRTEAPVKAHPLAVSGVAGNPAKAVVDVGGGDKNTDGVGTRSDKKIT